MAGFAFVLVVEFSLELIVGFAVLVAVPLAACDFASALMQPAMLVFAPTPTAVLERRRRCFGG